MRSILVYTIVMLLLSCKKAMIRATENNSPSIPWGDSSSRHPKNDAYQALIDKYVKKGLPGIAVLITDSKGTWVGSGGKADIKRNIPFMP